MLYFIDYQVSELQKPQGTKKNYFFHKSLNLNQNIGRGTDKRYRRTKGKKSLQPLRERKKNKPRQRGINRNSKALN